jgi:hypothetical protein
MSRNLRFWPMASKISLSSKGGEFIREKWKKREGEGTRGVAHEKK